MTHLGTHPCSASTFKRVQTAASARSADWREVLALAVSIPTAAWRGLRDGHAVPVGGPAEDLEEVEWLERPSRAESRPWPHDWMFWSFLMCTAVAALPLIGIRWTTPDVASLGCAFEDAILLALPVVVPLPFLLLGCVGALVLQPASRTPEAFGLLSAATAFGLGAAPALGG